MEETRARLEAEIKQQFSYSFTTAASGRPVAIVHTRLCPDNPWQVWHVDRDGETVVTHCAVSDHVADVIQFV